MTSQMGHESNGHKSQAQPGNPEYEDSAMEKMIKPISSCCNDREVKQFCPVPAKCLSACWSFYSLKYSAEGMADRAQVSKAISLSEVSLSIGTHTANVRPVSLQPSDQSSCDATRKCGLTLPLESRKEMGPPPDIGVSLPDQYDPKRNQHIVQMAPAPSERDAVLRVELWDFGQGCGKPRYKVEWELSEGSRLWTGVWLSRMVK